MSGQHQQSALDKPYRLPALLTVCDPVDVAGKIGIVKNTNGDFKRDAVFQDVGPIFRLVPFKLHLYIQ